MSLEGAGLGGVFKERINEYMCDVKVECTEAAGDISA